jgi:Family of unknown function (DUF5989)
VEDTVRAFEKVASTESGASVASELWYFLGRSKKWWLLPILLLIGAFGALMLLSGSAAAPFIYTLF